MATSSISPPTTILFPRNSSHQPPPTSLLAVRETQFNVALVVRTRKPKTICTLWSQNAIRGQKEMTYGPFVHCFELHRFSEQHCPKFRSQSAMRWVHAILPIWTGGPEFSNPKAILVLILAPFRKNNSHHICSTFINLELLCLKSQLERRKESRSSIIYLPLSASSLLRQ